MKTKKEKRKSRLLKIFLYSGILLFFAMTGCAPQAQVAMLERQVSGLLRENQKLTAEMADVKDEMKKIKSLNYGGGALAQIRKRQAYLDNRLTAIQGDLLRLSGQIDMIQHDGLNPVVIKPDTKALESANSTIISQTSNRDEKNIINKNTPAAGTGIKDINSGPSEPKIDLYQSAHDLFKQGNFMEAKQTFRKFIEKNPDSPRVANALYWSGDCEYKMQRFEEAILEYQKVISRHPDSNKVPDALLKQGLAFLKLGDRESTKIVLEKLIKKYPKSPQAATAKKQLKRIH